MAVEIAAGLAPLRVFELALPKGTAVGETIGVGMPLVSTPPRTLTRYP